MWDVQVCTGGWKRHLSYLDIVISAALEGFSSLKFIAVPHAGRQDATITRVSVTATPDSSCL